MEKLRDAADSDKCVAVNPVHWLLICIFSTDYENSGKTDNHSCTSVTKVNINLQQITREAILLHIWKFNDVDPFCCQICPYICLKAK